MKSVSTVQKNHFAGLGPLADGTLLHSETMTQSMLPLEKIYEHLDLQGRLRLHLATGVGDVGIHFIQNKWSSSQLFVRFEDGPSYIISGGEPSFFRKTSRYGFRISWRYEQRRDEFTYTSSMVEIITRPSWSVLDVVYENHTVDANPGQTAVRFSYWIDRISNDDLNYQEHLVRVNGTPGIDLVRILYLAKLRAYFQNIQKDEKRDKHVDVCFVLFVLLVYIGFAMMVNPNVYESTIQIMNGAAAIRTLLF